MGQLFKLTADPAPLGSVTLIREGEEEVTHEEIMKWLEPPSGIWEHVSCRIDGKRVHLFCDDNGRAFDLPANVRASVAYANHHLERPFSLDKLVGFEKGFKLWARDAKTMVEKGLIVAGDCLLWTGEMS